MKLNTYTLIRFIPSIFILSLLGFWIFKSTKPFDEVGYLIMGLAVVMVFLNLYFTFKEIRNQEVGLSVVDEMSLKIKEKAAAQSFKFSIYMWVFGILFFANMAPREKIIIGIGILCMAIFYAGSRIYYTNQGLPDEN